MPHSEQLVSAVRGTAGTAQGCYNRAIRGLPDPPDSRLTVNVTVGASGSVTRLNVTGEDFGGLKNCVTNQVRRWRFPPSSGSQQTRFPLVFTFTIDWSSIMTTNMNRTATAPT